MKHIDTIALQGSIADMRSRIAAEQSAMHKVQLGMARWRGASRRTAAGCCRAMRPSPPARCAGMPKPNAISCAGWNRAALP
jgi:hypothetical protein